MSRLARIASTALLTAGLVVLLDVGITLAWGEPVSTVRGWLAQRDAGEELERLEREFRPPPNASLKPREVRRYADRLAREAEPGKAIGRLESAAIDLNIVVGEGTDTESLRKGPGHYPETVFPGQPGTVAIAGHRTTYLAPFRHIDEIGDDDELRLEMPYATFTYRFERQRIVDPSQVGVVRDVDHDRLVLTACHPLYSAAQRIVVFARLVRVEPPGEAGVGPGPPVRREADEIDAPGPGPALAGLGGLAGIAALMWLVSGRRGARADQAPPRGGPLVVRVGVCGRYPIRSTRMRATGSVQPWISASRSSSVPSIPS
jgi:sortase A